MRSWGSRKVAEPRPLPPAIQARVRRLHAEASRLVEGWLLGQGIDPEHEDVDVDLGAMTYVVGGAAAPDDEA